MVTGHVLLCLPHTYVANHIHKYWNALTVWRVSSDLGPHILQMLRQVLRADMDHRHLASNVALATLSRLPCSIRPPLLVSMSRVATCGHDVVLYASTVCVRDLVLST